MKTIHEKQLFVPGKDSRKRRRQVDHRSFSRADAFKSLALENVRLDRVQDALENRSNSNGLDKSTEGRNNIPPLFSRGNANSTNTILHHRSKRAVDQAKVKKCKELERSSIQAEGTADTASGVSGIFGILDTFTFGALSAVSSGISAASSVAKAVIDVELLDMDCDDIPFEELKDILDERFNKVDKALDRNHGAIRENLKAIRQVDAKVDRNLFILGYKSDRNFDAILAVGSKVDRNLSILGYKSDRNFDAIEKNLDAISRNHKAIEAVENKVDRNFRSILSGFKTVQAQFKHTNEKIDQGFQRILDFAKQSKIEAVTSGLIAFIDYFIKEKNSLDKFTQAQLITKLEEADGMLNSLKALRVPHKSNNNLQARLYDILTQRFAIPEHEKDEIAFTALDLLCAGTEAYLSVMYFLMQGYSYLADHYYQEDELEKYNQYLTLSENVFKDFKHSLNGANDRNGLIDKVVDTLHSIKKLPFIVRSRKDIVQFVDHKTDAFNRMKSKLITISKLPQHKASESIKYDFTQSNLTTPIGAWEDRKRVSYAIQFKNQDKNSYSSVGSWSIPYTIANKTNPILDIGTAPQGETRLIFRKFDNNKPELVGIVTDSKQKRFKDISRDLYNAALEPNEDLAIDAINTFIKHGANIHAQYEKGRQAIHAAAQSGNNKVLGNLLMHGANIHAKDAAGYTAIHIAAEMGYENFIEDLIINHKADIHARTNLNWTPLHVAAHKGYVDTVKSLMQIVGLEVNAPAQGGFTPLHTAAVAGKIEVIDVLLQDKRVNANAKSEEGMTPLHLASVEGHVDAVNALLKNSTVRIDAAARGGLTALHLAVSAGHVAVVKRLLKQDGIDVNALSIDGWAPLHLAVALRKENMVSELLKDENIAINLKGEDQLTSLHLATITGDRGIASKLRNHGALLESADQYGYTPLQLAVEQGKTDMIDYLLEASANLYAKQASGYTPLGLAAYTGKLNIVEDLLAKGARVDVKNNDQVTPIDAAALMGHLDIVKLLIEKGAPFQSSALQWAAYGGKLKVVQYLVEEKKVSPNGKDHNGRTAMHEAAYHGKLEVLEYLKEKGAQFNIQDNQGNTPLHEAAYQGHFDGINYLIGKESADPNAQNNKGYTPLHLAAWNGYLDIANFLLGKGAEVNVVSKEGWTPILSAAAFDKWAMVKVLIEKGGEVDVVNGLNRSPLHFAAKYGNAEMVQFILGKGVNINLQDASGWTPLLDAAAAGRWEVVKYLVEHGADINLLNQDHQMPLHFAVTEADNENIIPLLINNKNNINSRDKDGYTPFQLAVANGHLEYMKQLIAAGANDKLVDGFGNPPLHIAAAQGNLNVVRYLIEARKVNIHYNNNKGSTTLHVAAIGGHADVVAYLVDKGVEFDTTNNDGESAFQLADLKGNLDVVRYFLDKKGVSHDDNIFEAAKDGQLGVVKYLVEKGATLKGKDSDGNTLLHLAAQNGHLNVVTYLLDDRHVGLTDKNNAGSTPLHLAVFDNQLEVVQYLASHKYSNLFNVKDKEGKTPLDIAREKKHAAIVKYFEDITDHIFDAAQNGNLVAIKRLERLLDLNIKDKRGNTPLHVAAQEGQLAAVKYLAEKGVNLNTKNSDGKTALDVAREHGHSETVMYLVVQEKSTHDLSKAAKSGYLDVVKYFIEDKKVGVNSQDSNGQTAAHWAAVSGSLDLIQYLTEKGANIHAADTTTGRKKPIHVAAQYGQKNMLAFLLTQGVKVDEVSTGNGWTPLHYAAADGQLEAAKFLVEQKANNPAALKAFIQTQDKDGYTALHWAAQKGHAEVIPALLKPFEGDPAALKEFIQTKNNEGKTALDKANGKDNVAKILSSYVRQKREISKASEEEVEELVDPKAFPSLIKDSVATATDHAEIPELSPTAASYQKQLLLEAIAPAEGFVASSAARPTPTTWLGDLWVWGKKLVVGSYSKPGSLDPLGGPLSSKPAVCSDQLHIGARPIGPTAGPTLLEMGDQWVKNSDTNGLLTWGSLLARKWTGSRPKAFQTPSYDPAIDVALSIRSHEWVDAFMAKVEEQAQACGIAKATSSAIVGSAELYTKAIETVRKKIAAGQEEGITASLFEQVVQQNSRKIAAKTTPKQTEQWLANVREALPKLKQQFLQQAAPLQNPCQAAARANTTSKPNISLLKQAMCSMQPTSQLADATNTLCMGNTHNVGDVLIQNGIEDRGQYRKCGNL